MTNDEEIPIGGTDEFHRSSPHQAERTIDEFRTVLKHWTFVATGLWPGDAEALRRDLLAAVDDLRRVAADHPERRPAIELLIGALKAER